MSMLIGGFGEAWREEGMPFGNGEGREGGREGRKRMGVEGGCSVDGVRFSSLRLDRARRRVRTMKYHLVYARNLIIAIPLFPNLSLFVPTTIETNTRTHRTEQCKQSHQRAQTEDLFLPLFR